MKSLGICIGSSTIGYVILENTLSTTTVIDSMSLPHNGNPKKTIRGLLNNNKLSSIDRLTVTGKKLRTILNASSISEPEAIEFAYKFDNSSINEPSVVVSAGGESFVVYEFDRHGKIIDVHTGNKCASGTGEFFVTQLKRMNLNIEDALEGADIESPYTVAGRCSVFCKSDCTHALNKGIPKERVVSGLCEMMATKILELLGNLKPDNILMIGGVSKNEVILHYLKNRLESISVPNHAENFEALGAALWGLSNETTPINDIDSLFNTSKSSFEFLSPLSDYLNKVKFKDIKKDIANKGDTCIIGLDVGSTTTKAVIIRENDNSIIGSCYLRTNGDPIEASRKCYEELLKQVSNDINIIGLGVTGSGRQISGLHGLTEGIINEITAHARAAVYFDPEVDTIFEIGGQDAKYTYLTNGVPNDYAMNEACSAGTGSFLEEAAKESLGIDTLDICDYALRGNMPPNFSDQCAAFISSDIKNAVQEGIENDDITAGLVYSIAMNYINRVKGSRKVGQKVFMQGGVSYNKAVPLAMAALTGKDIVVPPEPGLMGAFGVALVIKDKINLGTIKPGRFVLDSLVNRDVTYKTPFICNGGTEGCDRKCSINRILIEDKIYPFGGACSKYYNLNTSVDDINSNSLNLVKLREELIFDKYSVKRAKRLLPAQNKRIGISKTLLTNTLYPLYYNFFTALGYKVVSPDTMDKSGLEAKGASFCYPVEIAHCALKELLNENPDIIFLPHVKSMPIENNINHSYACPFVQGEPYYLKAAFHGLKNKNVISPVLELSEGYIKSKFTFMDIGRKLGHDEKLVEEAFSIAIKAQKDFHRECQKIGKAFLEKLNNTNDIGIVLFGRPYNAFSSLANMNIPHKFSSKGYNIIPHDFLPLGDIDPHSNMYWAMGQSILKSSKIVKDHPNLFGAYITNFSCGPDSFVLGYFRNIMVDKPSLTLELDSHTADAGIDTRIEAFLDVIKGYTELNREDLVSTTTDFKSAQTLMKDGKLKVISSEGAPYDLHDPKVELLIPSMGHLGSRLLASSFRYININTTVLDAPAKTELKLSQGLVSCKECLPLLLTVGSLVRYIKDNEVNDRVLVYFMPEASGPCRFGQYNILMSDMIEKNNYSNVAILSPTSENSYAGLGMNFTIKAWQSVLLSDILEEIYSGVLVLSKDREQALKIYYEVCDEITEAMASLNWKNLKILLRKLVTKLNTIDIKYPLTEAPTVALVGEIYVRRDSFSRQYIVEKLADKDIIVKPAPVSEWIYYCDYLVRNNILLDLTTTTRLKNYIQGFFKNSFEKSIKNIFKKCKFYEYHMINVDRTVKNVSHLISPKLTGEAVLTIGTAIEAIIEDVSGVISIGPFGCMPSRISEAILKKKINSEKPLVSTDKDLVSTIMGSYPSLPFLSIEADGNSFPQIIESKLEAFCLQVKRINNDIQEFKS